MKLSKTQQAFLEILGARHLFWWGEFFSISDRDWGYKHGCYDRAREIQARQAHCTVNTISALIKAGALTQVTWFRADAAGKRGYIYKAKAR